MRALVDTSVWSLALRKGGPVDHPAVRKLSALLDAAAAIRGGCALLTADRDFERIARVSKLRLV